MIIPEACVFGVGGSGRQALFPPVSGARESARGWEEVIDRRGREETAQFLSAEGPGGFPPDSYRLIIFQKQQATLVVSFSFSRC
ncbi:hypothetical protein BaRGS_00003469 [Batillaria attramentaria]|uniref:Uncharacterized protein n=1 Tax=Batillaria attramentaria TaxID=370345 RepID=A0ABD0M0V1_9CAEN